MDFLLAHQRAPCAPLTRPLRRCLALFLLVVASSVQLACGEDNTHSAVADHTAEINGIRKFLIISVPRQGKVAYLKINPREKYARPLVMRDLRAPMGVACDARRMNLFVADPEQKKVFYYNLAVTPTGGLTTTSKQKVAANNVQARWVAVDLQGNIFFSDEGNNMLMKVTADNFARGNPQPEVVYNGKEITEVSGPGGVAADGFNLFWTNKIEGTNVGSVCKGLEDPPQGSGVTASSQALSSNALKAIGVCIQQDNVFYTEGQGGLYGVKKGGGEVQLISSSMKKPRGCAGDGEGTVYVADKEANWIYEFPGNMARIRPEHMTPVINFEGVFGLSVLSEVGAAYKSVAPLSLLVLVASLAFVA